MLRKNGDHCGVLGKGILFEDPVPLQAQLDIPQCSKGISHCEFWLISLTMALREPPKFDKRGHELDLVTLGAYVCQTDHQVILEQALDDNAPVNSGEIEVDGESIYHFKPIILDEVFKDLVELCFGNVFDSTVLDELL